MLFDRVRIPRSCLAVTYVSPQAVGGRAPIRNQERTRVHVRCFSALKRRQYLARGVSPWEPSVPRTKSPEGATEPSIDLSPLRGLAICVVLVQGLTPLAKNCRLFKAKDQRQNNFATVAPSIV